MSNWLGSIVSSLWQLGDAEKSNGERLFSAVMLAIILSKLTQTDKSYALIQVGGIEQFRMEDLLKLLEMLVLNPNIDRKECTEYDFLIAMLCEQRLVDCISRDSVIHSVMSTLLYIKFYGCVFIGLICFTQSTWLCNTSSKSHCISCIICSVDIVICNIFIA